MNNKRSRWKVTSFTALLLLLLLLLLLFWIHFIVVMQLSCLVNSCCCNNSNNISTFFVLFLVLFLLLFVAIVLSDIRSIHFSFLVVLSVYSHSVHVGIKSVRLEGKIENTVVMYITHKIVAIRILLHAHWKVPLILPVSNFWFYLFQRLPQIQSSKAIYCFFTHIVSTIQGYEFFDWS